MNTAFSITPYRAEYEVFRDDLSSRWSPCEVIGIVVKGDDASYVVRLPARSGLESLMVVDYIRSHQH